MTTIIRPELSERNKYHVEKHRYYELKHFCLQYSRWKKLYSELSLIGGQQFDISGVHGINDHYSDPTSRLAEKRLIFATRIELIEQAAIDADPELANYILRGVTEALSYNQLKVKLSIPCSRDTYYDRYRRFFWLLDKTRN